MTGMRDEHYYVYLLSNFTNTVLYTGMTRNLLRRVQEHREGLADSFTKKYRVWKLVYYEVADSLEGAYLREQQIKGGSRQRKEALIKEANPQWRDFYSDLIEP
jgi:putative endonuclease